MLALAKTESVVPLHACSLSCRNAWLCGSTGAPAKTDVPVSCFHHPADSVNSASAGDILAQMVSHTKHLHKSCKLATASFCTCIICSVVDASILYSHTLKGKHMHKLLLWNNSIELHEGCSTHKTETPTSVQPCFTWHALHGQDLMYLRNM